MPQSCWYWWVHGHSGVIEYESNAVNIVRRGWGLEFWEQAETENWIHFSIPFQHSAQGTRLDYVKFHCALGDGARISQIAVYDGRQLVLRQEVNWQGQGDIGWDLGGGGVKPGIGTGLGISFHVKAEKGQDRYVTFHAVGAQLCGNF